MSPWHIMNKEGREKERKEREKEREKGRKWGKEWKKKGGERKKRGERNERWREGGEEEYGGAWWAAVHGVTGGRTRLSDFTFTFHFHALEKEMATHSSVLAWRIPGTGKPGGLLSMGSHRVGHDWSNLAAANNCKIYYLENPIYYDSDDYE